MDAAEQLGQPAPGQGLAVDEGGERPTSWVATSRPSASSSATSSQPSGTTRSRSTRPERANGDGLSSATAPWAPGRDLGRDPLGQPGPELGGLAQPHRDVVGHRVGPAAGDRVVPGGLDQPPPAELEERLRPAGPVQRLQRLGVAGQQPLGPGAGRLEPDPGRDHPHQDVGPRARPQLTLPARQLLAVGPGRART